jgi:hypothetical protein
MNSKQNTQDKGREDEYSAATQLLEQLHTMCKAQDYDNLLLEHQQLQDENKALKGLIKRQNAELWETICDLRALHSQNRLNEQGMKRLNDCVELYDDSTI